MDWKLRVAVPECQKLKGTLSAWMLRSTVCLSSPIQLASYGELIFIGSADAPIKNVHTFLGTFCSSQSSTTYGFFTDGRKCALVKTVLAAGSAVGFVLYTGAEDACSDE